MKRIYIDGVLHPFQLEQVNWFCQNPPAQFGIAVIGGQRFWVKRQRGGFTGWPIITHTLCERKRIPGTPLVVSIAKTEDEHLYFTKAYGKGVTLADCSQRQPEFMKSEATIKGVTKAIAEINQRGYWHPDLCPKNLLVDLQEQQLLLIDIDSCLPHSTPWSHDLRVSHHYSMILPHFAHQAHGVTQGLAHYHPECINLAESVALAADIRVGGGMSVEKQHQYLSQHHQRAYRQLFSALTNGKTDWNRAKQLIQQIVKA